MSLLDEVGCHGCSHVAQTNEPYQLPIKQASEQGSRLYHYTIKTLTSFVLYFLTPPTAPLKSLVNIAAINTLLRATPLPGRGLTRYLFIAHLAWREKKSPFNSSRFRERPTMDVSGRVQAAQTTVKDVVGERAQRMFQDFLEEYK